LFEEYNKKNKEEYKSKLTKIKSYLKKKELPNLYISQNININFPNYELNQINEVNNNDDKYDENMFYQDIAFVSQIYINNKREDDLINDLLNKLIKEDEKWSCCRFRCFCLPRCLIDPIIGIIVLIIYLLFFLQKFVLVFISFPMILKQK